LLDTAKNQIETLQENLDRFIQIFNSTKLNEIPTANYESQYAQTECTQQKYYEKLFEKYYTEPNDAFHLTGLLAKTDPEVATLLKVSFQRTMATSFLM
jgi:hypothetical protein